MSRLWPAESPTASRDTAHLVLATAGLLAVLAAAAAVMLGLTLTTALVGGAFAIPAPTMWPTQIGTILGHAGDPGPALRAPWTAIAGHATLFWACSAVIAAVEATVLTFVGRRCWNWWGPTPAGHATRAEIRAELSLTAARARARYTRPYMSAAERRKAPLEEVAAPLHRGPIGPLCTPLENPTGTLAPTQTGKTRRDLAHKVLAAPGALLCSTTKPDLLELTALARSRRDLAGPVMVFDTTGSVAWPAALQWSPIQGCTDPQAATRRAYPMVEAAAVGIEAGGGLGAGNDRVFRERATVVLANYLLAAALSGRSVDALVRWATDRATNYEAVDALKLHFPDEAANLEAELRMVARTADAVWMSVRRAVAPLFDPVLRRLCTPPQGRGFDARSFIGRHGSLYLIAGEKQAATAAPLLTALAEHWLTTAQEMALDLPARRHDPPATAVLDEVTNATPIPALPSLVSDSAGRGVIIHWAAQSRAKLNDTFGADRATTLLDNTTTMSVWGGLKDPATLEWAATLFGSYDQPKVQIQLGGWLNPGRSSMSLQPSATFGAGDIRLIKRDHVVIAHRALRAVLARTADVSDRRDWPQLRADVDLVRGGHPPIDTDGFSTADGPHRATPSAYTIAPTDRARLHRPRAR